MRRWTIILPVFCVFTLCGFLLSAAEQTDAAGNDRLDRYFSLTKLAYAALDAGDFDKAEGLARELLDTEQLLRKTRTQGWNDGNALYHGNSIIGIVALRRDNNIPRAKEALLTAGRTPGSPQLDSFGPNMALAQDLLMRGQREAVLQFIDLCRVFLKLDVGRLDRWAAIVRSGKVPSDGDWKASLGIGHGHTGSEIRTLLDRGHQ